jgi:hypothetical protein
MSDQAEPIERDRQRRRNLIGDRRFTLAMALAIRRGKENAQFGTLVDRSPWCGLRISRPNPVQSGCGSAAALCAAEGERGASRSRKQF